MHPGFPNLPPSRFVPTPDLFWHPSRLHGQAHVSRVMVHATRLVDATGQHALAPRLWAAVFIHDLARRHDGQCHRHGGDAAARLRAEPTLQARLTEAGLRVEDYPAIEAAVTAHSAPGEVSRGHAHWPLTALLKDADALDRGRLGDLDPRYLRHRESNGMVAFAQQLFDATDGILAVGEDHFSSLWDIARRLGAPRPVSAHGARTAPAVEGRRLTVLPCLDDEVMSAERERELKMPRHVARELGQSALSAIRTGRYTRADGAAVDWRDAVAAAVKAKVSIPPTAALPLAPTSGFETTRLQVTNETTMGAARRLLDAGHRPLALNFANGVRPGGGFLGGARAQEEALCRASALFATLEGDPMYSAHQQRTRPDSTDWVILSPDVPVFRTDDGTTLEEVWRLSIITSAAPVAYLVGQPEAGDLLQRRMRRLLDVARAYGYDALVLGAWGCGAFANDPERTARDFRSLLAGEFAGAFREVVFAITDWSAERKFLGPFRDVMIGG